MNNDLIRRSDATAHPFANGKYDRANASEEFIKGYESYREWLEGLPAVNQTMNAIEFLIAESRWRTWCESKFAPRSKTYATCVDVFCEYADDKCAQCKLSPQERVAFIERWVKDHPEEVNDEVD